MGVAGERAYRNPNSWEEGEGACWKWKRAYSSNGRPQAWNGKIMTHAHRLIYEELVGPIPAGYDLHHLCENVSCVNPEHMEPLARNIHAARHRKLSDADLEEIYERLSRGDRQVDIGNDLGVSQVRISQVKRGIHIKTMGMQRNA